MTEKLILTFENQEVTHYLENNEIHLRIGSCFRKAGDMFNWNKLGITNKLGIGVNRKLMKYAIDNKATFIIKIARLFKHTNISQTYKLEYDSYINYLKESEESGAKYPEWKDKHTISIIVFPLEIMLFLKAGNN